MNTPTLTTSEEARAPWNQPEPVPNDYDVTCCQVLSKTVQCEAYEGEENWGNVYHENDHYTPAQLIAHFYKVLKDNYGCGIIYKSPAYTQHLMKECKNWIEDEVEYIKN